MGAMTEGVQGLLLSSFGGLGVPGFGLADFGVWGLRIIQASVSTTACKSSARL